MKKERCSRRIFIKTGAAAVGMSVLSQSCERPVHKIIPALIQPEELVPGESMYYASMYAQGSDCAPVMVKIVEGKPIKINGNRSCPITRGSISVGPQASLGELYHPERILFPAINNQPKTKDEFNACIREKLDKINAQQQFIYLITPSVISPSEKEIIERLKGVYPHIRHFMLDQYSISALPDSYLLATGKRFVPYFRIDQAEVLVSFNCDFLGGWLSPSVFTAQYNKALHSQHFKHIQFESSVSLSGVRAQERYPIQPSEETSFLCSLYNTIARLKGQTLLNVPAELPDCSGLAMQLISAKALVLSGSNVLVNQLLVIAINNLIGGYDNCIDLSTEITTRQGDDHSFFDLVSRKPEKTGGIIVAGIDLLSVLGHYEGVRKWFDAIDFRLVCSMLPNYTTAAGTHICPVTHFLESWNDGMAIDGRVWLAQPLSKAPESVQSFSEWMLNWINDKQDLQTIIKMRCIANAQHLHAKDQEQIWEKSLQQGFYTYETAQKKPRIDLKKMMDFLESQPLVPIHQTTELFLVPPLHTTHDNPWTKELPHFVTSQSWGISAMASPEWMKKNHLSDGDSIRINDLLTLPVVGIPGHSDHCITVELQDAHGTNTCILSGIHHMIRSYSFSPSVIRKTKSNGQVIFTQKKIITTRQFLFSHLLKPYKPTKQGLYPEYKIESERPGMVIDIDKCTGCGSCIISCQFENNIPLTGKDQVSKGRLMHWLRIDRYFIQEGNRTSMVNIPVMCQHCFHAPCESVCPVSATLHSTDGINQMVYNRCIGTRFCANACPYKVRVYNWYDYTGTDPIPRNNKYADERWVKAFKNMINPDVTVRSRGVMEKCTLCYQRLVEQKEDGVTETACQEACPHRAIEFGNLTTLISNHNDLYELLGEAGTRPAILYKTKQFEKYV